MSVAGHGAVWNELPWYVSGTLDGEARASVERHLAGCEACRREVAHLRRVARAVDAAGPEIVAARGSWDRIEARIQGRRWAPSVPWRGLGLGAALAATVAGVALLRPWTQGADYATLTSEASDDLRVRPAPGADGAAVRALLEAEAVAVVSEGEGGLIRARAPEGADREALAERLTADPLVAYVGVDRP